MVRGLTAASLLTLLPALTSATPLGRFSERSPSILQARQANATSTSSNGTTSNAAAWDWTGDVKLSECLHVPERTYPSSPVVALLFLQTV